MKVGPVRWHWLYRGYLCLIALVVMVLWLEEGMTDRLVVKYYFLIACLVVFLMIGAIRAGEGEADPLMGQLIRWSCVVMLHLMLVFRFLA